MSAVSRDNPSASIPMRSDKPSRKRLKWLVALLCAVAGAAAFVVLSRAWSQTERREASLPALEAMAKRVPYDGALLALLGGRQAQAGEFAAAASTLQKAIAAGEGQADVWQTWAAAVAASGNRANALAVLNLGLHTLRSPADQSALQAALDRARALPPTAVGPMLAHAISPEGLGPLIARRDKGSFLDGLAYWWGIRHPEQSGYATRERWAQERPNDAVAQRLWGLALLESHRFPAAIEALTRAVTLAPGDPATHLARADTLRQQGQSAKAGREYLQCLKLRHDWLPALLGFGQASLDKNLIALSVSVFQKATAVAPKSADAWIGLGRAYFSTHIQLGQAVSAFQQAAQLVPGRTDFYADYFRALRMTFHYADAETVIRQRLRAAPNESQSHFLLALLLRDYQPTPARLSEAEQELRTSLRLTPHAESTEVELAQLLLQRHQPEEAVELLNDALSQNELNAKAIRMLERAYRQAGQPALAAKFAHDASEQIQLAQQLSELEDSEHRTPGDIKVHNQLAALYTRLGRSAEAEGEQQFAAYLRSRPDAARHGIQTLDAATSVSHPITTP